MSGLIAKVALPRQTVNDVRNQAKCTRCASRHIVWIKTGMNRIVCEKCGLILHDFANTKFEELKRYIDVLEKRVKVLERDAGKKGGNLPLQNLTYNQLVNEAKRRGLDLSTLPDRRKETILAIIAKESFNPLAQ